MKYFNIYYCVYIYAGIVLWLCHVRRGPTLWKSEKVKKSEKLLTLKSFWLIYKSSNFSKYFGDDVITILIVPKEQSFNIDIVLELNLLRRTIVHNNAIQREAPSSPPRNAILFVVSSCLFFYFGHFCLSSIYSVGLPL
jgi:hypothetical protein